MIKIFSSDKTSLSSAQSSAIFGNNIIHDDFMKKHIKVTIKSMPNININQKIIGQSSQMQSESQEFIMFYRCICNLTNEGSWMYGRLCFSKKRIKRRTKVCMKESLKQELQQAIKLVVEKQLKAGSTIYLNQDDKEYQQEGLLSSDIGINFEQGANSLQCPGLKLRETKQEEKRAKMTPTFSILLSEENVSQCSPLLSKTRNNQLICRLSHQQLLKTKNDLSQKQGQLMIKKDSKESNFSISDFMNSNVHINPESYLTLNQVKTDENERPPILEVTKMLNSSQLKLVC